MTETEVKRPVDLFGGPRGFVDSGVPPAVFVITNVVGGLTAAVWAAIGAAVVLLLIRVVRREEVRHAISGFFGIAIAAGIAKATGSAKNYFLPGFFMQIAYGLLCLVTAFTRFPVIGFVLRQISDKPAAFHDHPQVRRAYQQVTLAWSLVFFSRLIVQYPLYRLDRTGWLAAVKIGMGYPLFILAIALTMVWINRRTHGVVVPEDPHPDQDALPDTPFDEVRTP